MFKLSSFYNPFGSDPVIDMHFMEEKFARDRLQREHEGAIENLLDTIRVHVAG